MVKNNEDELCTAFTVSVDGASKHGVTTGVSAYDRSTTIQIILNENSGPEDIRRPGHMFPLIAHRNGTFGRRGHTEASTDLCEIAGLKRAAAIVELLGEDGHMAREAEIKRFVEKHGLVKVSVEEIVQFKKLSVLNHQETAVTKK
jgi:3,4-dihydroxy 2-butanone 4-phosphate synthase/GTP cyclohydrolase II